MTDKIRQDIEKSVQLSQMSDMAMIQKRELNPYEVIGDRERLKDKE